MRLPLPPFALLMAPALAAVQARTFYGCIRLYLFGALAPPARLLTRQAACCLLKRNWSVQVQPSLVSINSACALLASPEARQVTRFCDSVAMRLLDMLRARLPDCPNIISQTV